MAAQTVRTSEQICAEIEQTFGFLPPFFEPALPTPQILENLWQQTRLAYVDNPLSALFKEKLNALLSRFCTVPYCMIVHSAALRPLGMTSRQVLALLETPPQDQAPSLLLGSLPALPPEESAAPAPDSVLEETLLYCATSIFLEQTSMKACQKELNRLLGPNLYSHLAIYLAYIKTCHLWIEAHPEVSYQADQRAQNNLGPLLAEEPALVDFFRTYQVRVREQGLGRESRRVANELLMAEKVRTAGILESISDAFFALDAEWRFTYVNEQAERVIFQRGDDILGRVIWDVFPALVGSRFDHAYRRALTEGIVVTCEEYFPPLDSWYDVRVYPSPDGVSVFFQQVNERKAREAERERQAQRERFLTGLSERARGLTDPDAVIADAVRSVGQFLGVGRCVFGDIDLVADTCTIAADYCADESVASIVGVFPFSAFGPFVVAEYRAGRAVAVDDVRLDPLRVTNENVAPYEAMGIRAHITAPVVHSSRLVSVVAVHHPAPRHWTPEEAELLQAVVERTWLTVEVLRQQSALAREAEKRERLAEDSRLLLDATGDGIYGIDCEGRFTFLNRTAERMLGFTREQVIGRSGHALIHYARPDGSSYPEEACPIHRALRDAEGVRVEDDVFWRADGTAFPVSYSAAPIFQDGAARGAVVTFSDISERRAMEQEGERLAAQQRAYLRDVLLSVTEGHLLLCATLADLPAPLTPFGGPVSLSRESGLRELRHLALDAGQAMAEEAKHDLVTAASEAAMNAVVHGGGGTGQVSVGADGTVQVRVEDHGTGISMENLPQATLSRGFSTKATLGHGLKMMIETANRLYLLTGPTGTTVVLEQEQERLLPAWL